MCDAENSIGDILLKFAITASRINDVVNKSNSLKSEPLQITANDTT